jgi:hypothetical protein
LASEERLISGAAPEPNLGGPNGGVDSAYWINRAYDDYNARINYVGIPRPTEDFFGSDRRGNLQRSSVFPGNGVTGLSTFQDSLLPLVRQLVETNNQLGEILLNTLGAYQRSEPHIESREDDPASSAFDVDLEEGRGIATPQRTHSDLSIAGTRDSQHAVIAEAATSTKDPFLTPPPVQDEAGLHLLNTLDWVQPAIPGCQWLVPYGTFLSQVPSCRRGSETRSKCGSIDSWESRRGSNGRSSNTQGPRPLINFYSTMFLSSEFLAEGVIVTERNERLERAKGEYMSH